MRAVHLAASPQRARLLFGLLLPVLLLAFAGCFSTIPPETEEPSSEPEGDPNAAIIRGLTLHRYGPGEVRSRPHWSVEVRWYKGERPTLENRIHRSVRPSNESGVYEFSITDRRVTWVQVRELLCSFDPNDPRFECCLSTDSPCGECPPVWDDWTTRQINPGLHLNKVDLLVQCGSSS